MRILSEWEVVSLRFEEPTHCDAYGLKFGCKPQDHVVPIRILKIGTGLFVIIDSRLVSEQEIDITEPFECGPGENLILSFVMDRFDQGASDVREKGCTPSIISLNVQADSRQEMSDSSSVVTTMLEIPINDEAKTLNCPVCW